MFTNLLEVIGLLLLIIAVGLTFGVPAGLAATGVCCLSVSFLLARGHK